MNKLRLALHKVVLTALILGAACSLPSSALAQQDVQSGVTEGVLVDKGEAWIAVRPDDSQEVLRFAPRWVGGMPRMGGGPDKRILAIFQQLQVGTRLKVSWIYAEGLRAINVQVLPPREGGANGGAGEDGKSGVATGIVTGKGENWIAIRADGEQESTKLIPRWIGGMPKDGGGFDKKMLQIIAQTPVGARVRVEWIFEEHLRVVALRPAQ